MGKTGEKIAQTRSEENLEQMGQSEWSGQPAEIELTEAGENAVTIDWTKLYPILVQYQSRVDCEVYYQKFTEMSREMMEVYQYSVEDTFLVLKDLMYQVYLEMTKGKRE